MADSAGTTDERAQSGETVAPPPPTIYILIYFVVHLRINDCRHSVIETPIGIGSVIKWRMLLSQSGEWRRCIRRKSNTVGDIPEAQHRKRSRTTTAAFCAAVVSARALGFTLDTGSRGKTRGPGVGPAGDGLSVGHSRRRRRFTLERRLQKPDVAGQGRRRRAGDATRSGRPPMKYRVGN